MSKTATPIARQWKMLECLASTPKGVTRKDLAKKLSTCIRTIDRDLATLRASGVPLEEEVGKHGAKTWRLETQHFGTGPTFSYDEAAALYIGRRFLEPMMGTFLWEAAHSGLRKMRESLGPRSIQNLERMVGTIRGTMAGQSDYSSKSDLIDTIMLGCEDQRQVAILYQSAEATEPSKYSICPYQLLYHNGSLYVIGFSCKRNEIRHWKMDRVSGATITSVPFEIPADFDFDNYEQTMFGVYHPKGDQRVTIRVRFDSSVARYVQEHRWHVSQKAIPTKDGSVIVELSVAETPEIKHWILGFGCCAEVLEPDSLRRDIANEVKKLCTIYDPSRSF